MKSFGIIGAGMIAAQHAMAIKAMTNGRLEAVYARDHEKANAFSFRFHCAAYSDFEDFLANDLIEIVTIATPSGAHLEFVNAAAVAGKHIICEKPLEVTPERIRKMIEVSNKCGVTLSGILNRRFNPAVSALKDAIEKGRFGILTLCDAAVKWYRTQEYYDSGDWRGTIELDGGGALMNQSIHTIDLLIYLVGNVKRVAAHTALLTHENIEVEDTAVAIVQFENGAMGTIQGSTSCWSGTGHPAEIQICGSEGSVFMEDERFRVWDFKHPYPEDEQVRSTLMCGNDIGLGANDPGAINFIGHQRNFEDVVHAIENQLDPLVTGEEAMKSVLLIRAIYESARNQGKWITL